MKSSFFFKSFFNRNIKKFILKIKKKCLDKIVSWLDKIVTFQVDGIVELIKLNAALKISFHCSKTKQEKK